MGSWVVVMFSGFEAEQTISQPYQHCKAKEVLLLCEGKQRLAVVFVFKSSKLNCLPASGFRLISDQDAGWPGSKVCA